MADLTVMIDFFMFMIPLLYTLATEHFIHRRASSFQKRASMTENSDQPVLISINLKPL